MTTQRTNPGFYSTPQLCERFQRSAKSIKRWMDQDNNPFPKPRIVSKGGASHLWAQSDVHAWEESLKQ